ncbi:ARM REPEAT PROTEIN INTERACTING WITH [Arachis hypogaea]|nr:ARM REPEAT PROTEIN INTERACTING WITH [Arachis hypogaea]
MRLRQNFLNSSTQDSRQPPLIVLGVGKKSISEPGHEPFTFESTFEANVDSNVFVCDIMQLGQVAVIHANVGANVAHSMHQTEVLFFAFMAPMFDLPFEANVGANIVIKLTVASEIRGRVTGVACDAILAEVQEQVSILNSTFSWKESDRAAAKRHSRARRSCKKRNQHLQASLVTEEDLVQKLLLFEHEVEKVSAFAPGLLAAVELRVLVLLDHFNVTYIVSAYESLTLRGYDVVAVVLGDHSLLKEGRIMSYMRNKLPILVLPSVPKAIIYVVDSSDTDRLVIAKEEFHAILEADSEVHIHWKGATEIVLACCPRYIDANDQLIDMDEEKDPCRPGVKDSVELCQKYGVKVVRRGRSVYANIQKFI